jgi:hypothetical protein
VGDAHPGFGFAHSKIQLISSKKSLRKKLLITFDRK